MIRILSLLALATTALLSNSCCCTSDAEAPKLKSLPRFKEFAPAPTPAPAPEVEVHSAK